MTKKANALKSLESINILLDKVYEEKTAFTEVRPYCTYELSRIRRILAGHPFADDINELIDTAIAYSDSLESLGYVVDDLYNAVECL